MKIGLVGEKDDVMLAVVDEMLLAGVWVEGAPEAQDEMPDAEAVDVNLD